MRTRDPGACWYVVGLCALGIMGELWAAATGSDQTTAGLCAALFAVTIVVVLRAR